jgi:hypothetical protein
MIYVDDDFNNFNIGSEDILINFIKGPRASVGYCS